VWSCVIAHEARGINYVQRRFEKRCAPTRYSHATTPKPRTGPSCQYSTPTQTRKPRPNPLFQPRGEVTKKGHQLYIYTCTLPRRVECPRWRKSAAECIRSCCSRRAAGAHHLLLCAEARASMLRAGVLAALLALGNAQWEPEDLPVFMPDKPHELEAYEPVADKASVVLSPMAGARPCCLPPLLRLAHAGAKARGHLGSAQRLASRCLRIASSAWSTASRASSRTSRRWGS
jgi:hypothetical protein